MSINIHNSRILHSFSYYSPTTIDEAVKLLFECGSGASILAGGTDLIPKMKQGLVRPSHVVNIKKIPELVGIIEDSKCIRIGALTHIREIEQNQHVKDHLKLLHDAVASLGSVQIRNMATLGGNLCNASPAADSAQALIALDAKAHINGPKRERVVDLENFFNGPGKTVLLKGEILTSVEVPKAKKNSISCFMKLGRTSLDLATVSIAVQANFNGMNVEEIGVVLGAVAPTPLRVKKVEDYLIRHQLDSEQIESAADLVSRSIKPITDIRGSAEYRRKASKGLTLAALSSIANDHRGSYK